MSNFRDDLNDLDLVCFFDYWAALCGDRPMPARKDIDPTQIRPAYLPDLMLIDVLHDPRRYRYRLVGTNVVQATGADRTGQFSDDVSFFQAYPIVLQQYDRVVETRQPLYSVEKFTNLENQTNYDVDRLLLPLSRNGRLVDMLLVFFQFRSGPCMSRSASWRSASVNAKYWTSTPPRVVAA